MFTPPSRASLPIFTDEDTKPNARATVAVLATLTQLQHAITQFVAYHPSPWWRRSNLDRGPSRRRAILRRNRMKIATPPLLKMRSIVSEDGRWARFFLLFTTGQNAAFSLPFSKIGLFLKTVKR